MQNIASERTKRNAKQLFRTSLHGHSYARKVSYVRSRECTCTVFVSDEEALFSWEVFYKKIKAEIKPNISLVIMAGVISRTPPKESPKKTDLNISPGWARTTDLKMSLLG